MGVLTGILIRLLLACSGAFSLSTFRRNCGLFRSGIKNNVNTRCWSTTSSAPFSSLSMLYMTTSEDGASTATNESTSRLTLSYLGRGSSAIVREGSVLVAPSNEYNHLLTKSAVFIYAVGLNDNDENVARGVIIDHATAFSVSEMIDESYLQEASTILGNNTLFRGGDIGEEAVMLLHSHRILANTSNVQEMIGSSGVYQGGLSHVIHALKRGQIADPTNSIKFFFNYVEFTEKQLDMMFTDKEVDSSDAWMSVEVPPSFVLHEYYNRGTAWEKLRNLVRSTK